MSDQPHTLYRQKGQAKQEDVDEATRLMMEAYERKKQREREEKGYDISEVFDGKADMDLNKDE